MLEKAELARRAEHVRAWLQARWEDFRAESLYFQARAALVVGYVGVVVLTVLLVPPNKVPWLCVEDRITFGLSFKTVLEITNVDNGDLEGVTIEVQGSGVEYDGRKTTGVWLTKPLDLQEGVKHNLLTEQLFDQRGISPTFSLEVAAVSVVDEDGERIAELTCAPKKKEK